MAGRRAGAIATLVSLLIAGAAPAPAIAERLAARRYTTADGLAGDYIIAVYRDSRGFLWFSTRDGLSRFDGVKFTTYGVADGLPAATVNHLIETRAGVYWVTTNGGGICRLNPQGRRPSPVRDAVARRVNDKDASFKNQDPLFTTYRLSEEPATNRVNVAYEDRAGRLWFGTDDGLFRMDGAAGAPIFTRIEVPFPRPPGSSRGVGSLFEDAEGSLWIGGGLGMARRLADGRMVGYHFEPIGARDAVQAFWPGDEGHLWVGFRSGLLRFEVPPAASFKDESGPITRSIDRASALRTAVAVQRGTAGARESTSLFTTASGLPDDVIGALYLQPDGHLWIGTARGMSEFDGRNFRLHGTAHGIPESHVTGLMSDSEGSLWITSVAGATKVIRNGLVTYDEQDGLPNLRIHSLAEDQGGHLVVVSGDYRMSRLDGGRFTTTRARLPHDATCNWMSRCAAVDPDGGWWFTNASGLYHWDPVERLQDLAVRPARAVYTKKNGLPDDAAFTTFIDAQRNLWVGTGQGRVTRWQRSSNSWREYSEADGLPALRHTLNPTTAFAEDKSSNVWVGFNEGGLARLDHGRFRGFGVSDGVPSGSISALHVDAAGRLWIASTQGGLARVDDPAAPTPIFRVLTTAEGLSSDNIRCLTEDTRGRVYAGTSRGVDRIDPATGSVKHFSVREGLASDFVTAAFRDSTGAIWFGTISGLSRVDPFDDGALPVATAPPAVFISSLRVGGALQQVAELGDITPPALTLPPDRNQLEIGYFGFSFETGEPLRYQYRLEGGDTEWSSPSELRSVNYARLAPGHYRFLARAVRPDGVTSTKPAVVTFSVLPPFYARWWFIALTGTMTVAIGLVLYRMRIAQLLRVERVRARIATDLHDDIGASLSQIAILAEVARARLGREAIDPLASDPLARIAETSRGLVDSMSDIVWAINPEVDTLADLSHRMRRFVEDTLGAGDVEVVLRVPATSEDVKLGADVRREVFLILKESVTNVAKHANCTRVEIELESDRRRLRLRVSDNGRGFDPSHSTDGNGVASMQRRVVAMGGLLAIDTAPGLGTTISFDVLVR